MQMSGIPKIFCVGLYKTGTTSLHRFFQAYDLRSYHGPAWVGWCRPGKAPRLDKYDCFSDGMEHPLEFIYERYPQAKFIYTTRSLRGWMISRHMHRRLKSRQLGYYFLIAIGMKKMRGIRYRDKDVKTWPQDYHDHEKRVCDFFENKPGQLLVIDIFADSAEEIGRKIHAFLQLPGKPRVFPHQNVAPNALRHSSEQAIDRVLRELGLSTGDPVRES